MVTYHYLCKRSISFALNSHNASFSKTVLFYMLEGANKTFNFQGKKTAVHLQDSSKTRCLLFRSLGCTVVEMLSSKPPWQGFVDPAAVIFRIGTSDKPEYRLPDTVSDRARTFLERCFIRDPLQRPSASELLSDPFIWGMSTLRHQLQSTPTA